MGVAAGDGGEQDGGVFDGFGVRTDGVLAEADWDDHAS